MNKNRALSTVMMMMLMMLMVVVVVIVLQTGAAVGAHRSGSLPGRPVFMRRRVATYRTTSPLLLDADATPVRQRRRLRSLYTDADAPVRGTHVQKHQPVLLRTTVRRARCRRPADRLSSTAVGEQQRKLHCTAVGPSPDGQIPNMSSQSQNFGSTRFIFLFTLAACGILTSLC